MKRTIGLLLTAIFAIGVWMPMDASAQRYERRVYQERSDRNREYWRDRQRRMRSRMYRNMGYRNYGQYRRTQVGNRRYRWEQRTYYQNGRRYTRRIRINF